MTACTGKAFLVCNLTTMFALNGRFEAVHVCAAIAKLPKLIYYRSGDIVDRADTVVAPVHGVPR